MSPETFKHLTFWVFCVLFVLDGGKYFYRLRATWNTNKELSACLEAVMDYKAKWIISRVFIILAYVGISCFIYNLLGEQ